MQVVFFLPPRHNGFFQTHVQDGEVAKVKTLSGFFLVFLPVHCAKGSFLGLFRYPEICDPSIYICVLTMGKKLRGPFVDWQKEDANCVMMKVGEQLTHVVVAQDALGQRSL